MSTACGSATTIDLPPAEATVDQAVDWELVDRRLRPAALVGVLVAARPGSRAPPDRAAQLRRSGTSTRTASRGTVTSSTARS